MDEYQLSRPEYYSFFSDVFPTGYLAQMRILREYNYDPITTATVIEERMGAEEMFLDLWDSKSFDTGDGIMFDTSGAIVIDLDSRVLREVTEDTTLIEHGVAIKKNVFEEARDRDGTLYLTADQICEADGKGWVKRRGVWQPSSTLVGDIWKGTDSFPGLARDQREILPEYAELVASKSREGEVMRILPGTRRTGYTLIRPVTIYSVIEDCSDIELRTGVSHDRGGQLVGVDDLLRRARELVYRRP